MGKILVEHIGPVTVSADHETDATPQILTGEAAERVHQIFTRPARKPTPAMEQAIENYKRLKAARNSI